MPNNTPKGGVPCRIDTITGNVEMEQWFNWLDELKIPLSRSRFLRVQIMIEGGQIVLQLFQRSNIVIAPPGAQIQRTDLEKNL